MRSRQLRAVKIGQTALDAFRALEDRAAQDALCGAIVRYCLTGEEPAPGIVPPIVWKMIQGEVARILAAEAEVSAIRASAGRRGGLARQAKQANASNEANASCQANEANEANQAIRIEENRVEENRIEENRVEKRESEINARTHAREKADIEDNAPVPPPMTLQEAKAAGVAIGLTEKEVEKWYVHYGSDSWRFKPTSRTPMDRSAAILSLSNWRTRDAEYRAKRKQGEVASYLPPEGDEDRHEEF